MDFVSGTRIAVTDRKDFVSRRVLRDRFETFISASPDLKKCVDLGAMKINREFAYYMNDETEAMWLGFAFGMRSAERMLARGDDPRSEEVIL